MTAVPDWLVERVALDEVPPASRDRLAGADLSEQLAAVKAANAAELAAHPAGPAVAQIEERVATAAKRAAERRRLRRVTAIGLATSVAAIAIVAGVVFRHAAPAERTSTAQITYDDGTRVKGHPRVIAFRQVGDHAEKLAADAVVHEGDLLQLRYNAGGHPYGVIASLDGAGVVTLHFPVREDAPTTMAPKTTALPEAYALDNAPKFERFFIITSADPIDVPATLASVRALGARPDGGDAELDLPAGLHQWSLRLRKGTP